MGSVFSIPTYFVLFRETTEAAIVIGVLLSWCHQMFADDLVTYRRLRKQVWLGTGLGLLLTLIIAAIVISVYWVLKNNIWEKHEFVWEATLAVIASFLITVVGVVMLKSSKSDAKEKWRRKLVGHTNVAPKSTLPGSHLPAYSDVEGTHHDELRVDSSSTTTTLPTELTARPVTPTSNEKRALKLTFLSQITREKYALFFIPFITILREGIEAVIFMGGIGFNEEWRALPLAAITGILTGGLVGYSIYVGGNRMSLHYFFLASTMLLLIIAAGLFANGVLLFEINAFQKSLWFPSGSGDEGDAILVNINHAVWYLDCCKPKEKGWTIFKAIVGWNNVGTEGSVSAYCLYWVAVAAWLVYIKLRAKSEKMHENATTRRDVGVAHSGQAVDKTH
ncbi:iron permease FTR1 family-domain-containing protein [Fimicolochytrium jonesii]|uniref:iron permease FTR1 family-domain-containing protein n=1 Tax=Fimicolochytrium jonesii TaxID=1396493 RepID=UPI0022FF07FA|nr:iron permease FTR1 family-domain-containing protein [Fimicolochytrium jonesii]KAI8816603.1 iron permease FTR1 family-domain-containing protein [Fimicolochytrium jonesii]